MQTRLSESVGLPLRSSLRCAPKGLLSLGLPASLGGPETSVAAAMHAIEQLSYADGATGWNAMIAYDGGLWSGYLSGSGVRLTLRSISNPILAGSIQPPGRVQRVAGGYRLSGQWRFGSGCQQADVFFAAAILYEGDHPVLNSQGMPEMRQVTLRAADVEIVDTWRVTGLRGTGSHDFAVNNLTVGDEFVEPFNFEAPVERGTLYSFPLMGNMATAKTAVALGIARHVIESFVSLAAAKTATHQTNLLRERSAVQRDLARAEACIRSARCFMHSTIDDVWATVAATQPATDEQRAMLRLVGVDGMQRAVETVDLVFNAAGTTSIHDSSPLERCFRDVHMVPSHFVVQPANYEAVGRVLLRMPPGAPLF